MKDAEEEIESPEQEEEDEEDEDMDDHESSPPSDSNDGTNPSAFDDDDGDPFGSAIFGSRGPLGLQSTLRALSGMMSGMTSRLREILCNLRMKEDPSIQLIALQELSDLLLVSNEDNLAGAFAPDPYVKELVALMQPSDFGEENPEIMLLACRCLANLMEALQGSVANVVYGGAVPILCQKLLDIQFIDLAEQALSVSFNPSRVAIKRPAEADFVQTLSKISVDFPGSIVREGGLTACLTYLDFFPTSTQRTAVTTAANCCRNLPTDSFPVVRDVMPTLLNVLSSNDPKVVEQGCLCVSRIVESFKHKPGKLEELIEPAMLKAVLRLLLPGTTNLIGPHIHTQFLRVLAITCKASPRLSAELLRMDVVDTLYQILTGVSPPQLDKSSVKMDGVLVMQALIHRPREQVFETLNVICELLPGVPASQTSEEDGVLSTYFETNMTLGSHSPKTKESAKKRRSLLMECKAQLKRFAMILLPTLTDAFSSTVNLGVRQKVLVAQLKMLHNLDVALIEEALCTVPYASFLGAILSQKDHPSLVSLALRCAELLFQRLEHVYQYQFHREGVISEIVKLSEQSLSTEQNKHVQGSPSTSTVDDARSTSGDETADDNPTSDIEGQEGDEDEDADDDNDNDDEDDDQDGYPDDGDISVSDSLAFDTRFPAKIDTMLQDLVIRDARAFVEMYEASEGKDMRNKALEILDQLQALAADIKSCYKDTAGDRNGLPLFKKLASYFDGDALESITSSELLNSGVINVLLDVFGDFQSSSTREARTAFLQAFMGTAISEKAQSQSTATTPFSVLINKLQDLLSRTEHFEVMTVNQNSLENSRSNAIHMLGKQIRLKLVADEDSDIPRTYKNIMVSIHAIATFKSLDDFLHPRISLADRPRASNSRDTLLSQLANAARLREQLTGNSDRSSGSGNDSPRSLSAVAHSSSRPNEPSGNDPSTEEPQRAKPRRSGRHQQAQGEEEEAQHDEPLECADARQVSDGEEDEDEDGDGADALNAIVDDMVDDDDEPENHGHDPSAVNMEVASTGKVTARKEDGTRVSTPSQSTPVSKSSSSRPAQTSSGSQSLATAGRPSSYAAAIASPSQDWHIEFSIDGKPLSNETTIYRAVHHDRENVDISSKNVWSAIHTIKFKRVPGPPPPEPTTAASGLIESIVADSEMPRSLNKNPTTASILRLLGSLHEMNATLDDILAEIKDIMAIKPEPLAQFINTKLTAKLNRQLEEPLIVASSCLPSWSEDLARLFPFLFPFETRHLFLQSTAFGYSRAMLRWQSSHGDDNRHDRPDDRPFLGRLQRQKVRISRSRILESAMKVMELYGSSPSILEIEYFEEVGTGLGPTLEFYSTISKEFSKKKLKMWRENDCNHGDEYAFGKRGLFPAPMSDAQSSQESGKKQLQLFKILGKFVARSMLDSRIIDVFFNPAFFRIADSSSSVTPSLGTVKAVDHDLANSLMLLKRFASAKKAVEDKGLSASDKAQALQQVEVDGVKVDDLGLDFTLPGFPSIDLIKDGSNTSVTIENVDLYVDRVVDMTLGSGVCRQVEAFRAGFSQVFAYSSLKTFTPSELVILFGQSKEDWSIETLMDSIKADHGFNMDSRSVRNLLQTMSEFDMQQRRDFLQFVTGSPKLPIGGTYFHAHYIEFG